MTRSYIWSLPTRLFHILLIVFTGIVFLLAEFDNLLEYHAIVGFVIGLLFLFRIGYGFLDIKYSRFKDFNFELKELIHYLLNIFGKGKEYIGHNPAASWAVVFVTALGLLSVVSGIFVYGTQEGMGIFSFLNISLFKNMDLFKDIHELFANGFMVVIFLHIAGVMMDRFLHKSKAIESMINGYKEVNSEELKLTIFQKIFGILWIGLSIALFFYLLFTPSSILIADGNIAVDYKVENKLFEAECKSCHALYPPFLLPQKSWIAMMDNLENHFGDDASIDEIDKEFIKKYLVANSAESSTKESAYKILKSIKDDEILAITKTTYWERQHKKIDKEIFDNQKVGKISNCKACHSNIEQGLLNDKDIKIPNI